MDERPPDLAAAMWTAERRFVHLRRTGSATFAQSEFDPAQLEIRGAVGLALSGGGIRSATISLGILQGLARKGLLRAIDYVSSVSGGGYMGSFLSALYLGRPLPGGGLARPGAAEQQVMDALAERDPFPVSWLRENGRYLAPNGAGDLALAGAVVARNLIAVHVVLGTLVLAILLSANGLRIALAGSLGAAAGYAGLAGHILRELQTVTDSWLVHRSIWISPLSLVVPLLLVFWVIPSGISYWLAPSDERDGTQTVRVQEVVSWTSLGVLVLAASLAVSWAVQNDPNTLPIERLLLTAALTGVVAVTFALHVLGPSVRGHRKGLEARNWHTYVLRGGLLVTCGAAAVAVVDSLGQTVFLVASQQGMIKWIGGGITALTTVATFAHRVAGALGERTKGRPTLPVAVLAFLGAGVVVFALLVSLAALAHALTWGHVATSEAKVATPTVEYEIVGPEVGSRARIEKPPSAESLCLTQRDVLCLPEGAAHMRYVGALVCCWVLTLLFSRAYPFVNRSSLAALYGARLARAYLGASNPARREPANQSLISVLAGDELDLRDYRPQLNGGPLHIINVTLNETTGGRSQIAQRDRHGMGMAIGPAGLSVGVRHHATWTELDSDHGPRPGPMVGTEEPNEGFRVFPRGTKLEPSWPTVGRWMAISGAAVSTGLGSRTSLGLSMLLGLLNFRLGVWWQSGTPWERVSPSTARTWTAVVARWASLLLPVQMHLLNELLARFPGTTNSDWYLTDGGHFENTGAYELIRRRLPMIIVCDNGADPARSLDDLGGLVRKARTDFGAHVEFLDADQIKETGKSAVLGTLAELGFCGRLAEVTDPAARRSEASSGSQRASRYATLARITYLDDPAQFSLLLVLRPAVLGSEPLDVLNYQVANPQFPQQSTGDQFFDEAQWEAYRRLGEHIACVVFEGLEKPEPKRALGWVPVPRTMFEGLKRGCTSAPRSL